MTRLDARRFAVLLAAVLIACVALSGCGPRTKPMPDQPTHVLPFSDAPPASAEEWVRLRNALDDARAVNVRLDREVESAIAARDAARSATWKRFGAYSWFFMVPGVLMLLGSFMPFLSWLKPARSMAIVLIGLGFVCAAIPFILDKYGDLAFIPMALVAGLWVVIVLGIDIWSRINKARKEAKQEANVAAAVLDKSQPDVGPLNLIAVRAANSPAFAAALETALPNRSKE